MSELIKVICDGCEREVRDVYSEIGWTILQPPHNSETMLVTVTDGRDTHGQAKSRMYFNMTHVHHFCCKACFWDYVQRNGKKKEACK